MPSPQKSHETSPGSKRHAEIIMLSILVGAVVASGGLLSRPTVLSYTVIIGVPQAAEFQQTAQLWVQHSSGGSSTLETVPTLLGVYWAYNSTQPTKNGPRIDVETNSTDLSEGTNMVFTAKLLSASSNNAEASHISVYIFDPLGILEGAYPMGAPINSVDQSFSAFSTGGLLTGVNYAALTQGALAFTFHIPKTGTTIGGWRVFVFTSSFMGASAAANATTFTVEPPPQTQGSLQRFLGFVAGPFGVASSFYGWAMLVVRAPRTIGASRMRKLNESLPLIMLATGFILLGYYVVAVVH